MNKKLLCAFLMVITVFLVPHYTKAASNIIIGDNVNFRSTPRIADDNIISRLDYGTEVEILDEYNDWYLVTTSNLTGYVAKRYVDVEDYTCVALATATVNFRKGPDTSYKAYSTIPKGTVIKVLDTSEKWYKVEYKNTVGYVHSDYLKTKEISKEFVIGIYSTKFSTSSSQTGRVKNIQKSASLINEHTVRSGETFSLLEMIGPITKAGGYYEAPEYKKTPFGTETVTGYGGGVCQLATTLYQSVCDAQYYGSDIQIVEHHHHSKSVSYVEDGEDATISWTANQDFKFKNDNSYTIKIYTYVDSGVITCMIYRSK